MNENLELEPGMIHPMRDGFVVALRRITLTKTKVDESPLPLPGMFEIRPIRLGEAAGGCGGCGGEATENGTATKNHKGAGKGSGKGAGEVVGYFLHTGYKVIAAGAYVCAHLKSKAGKATEAKTILRADKFVVIDIPGCGTIAIAGEVNSSIATLLKEQ